MLRSHSSDSNAYSANKANSQLMSSGGSDYEDYELPMLEHTTALSDGYASPRPLDAIGFRRESLDVEAAGLSVAELQEQDLELGHGPPSKAIRRRCACCGGLCSFVLSHWSKAVLMAIIITLVVLVSCKGVSIFSEILNFFERWNSWGGWGIFIGMFILNVTLFLPSVALILGAGFIFGFWKGLLAVWAGGAVGQSLSFLLARYLVKDAVATYVAHKWSKWDLVEHVLEQEGWKMVLLLRLSPLVPWNLLNIAMASTNVSFFQFTVASSIGIGFESSVLCYFGSLAQNIRDIVSGDAKPAGVVVYVLAGVSLLFCLLAAILATISVRRALKRAHAFRQTQDAQNGIPPGSSGDPEARGFLHEGSDGSEGNKLTATDHDQLPRPMAAVLQTGSGFSSDDSGDEESISNDGHRTKVHTTSPATPAGGVIRGPGVPGSKASSTLGSSAQQRRTLSRGQPSGDQSLSPFSVGGSIELWSASQPSPKHEADTLSAYQLPTAPDFDSTFIDQSARFGSGSSHSSIGDALSPKLQAHSNHAATGIFM